MAGIGFKLRQMTEEGGLLGFFGGYSTAAAIMAGPWLITVFAVGLLSLLSPGISRFELYITHIYPVSLILVGFIQFPATRHLADLLYVKEYDQVLPALDSTLVTGLTGSSLIGLWWALTTPGPSPSWAEKLAILALLNAITGQWISLIFLVTIHRYLAILAAFAVGGILSVLAGVEVGGLGSTMGALLGFLFGQSLTLLILLAAFTSEHPGRFQWDFGFINWIMKSPSLALAGGLFYLGSFADKLVFRYSGLISDNPYAGTVQMEPWLYLSYPYEALTFLAQLTIVPALAIFYIKLETGLYEVYKAFYDTIENRGTLEELRLIKTQILVRLKETSWAVFSVQGLISTMAVLLAPNIFPWVVSHDIHASILRLSIVGAFFGIFVLLSIVIFLYFEFYREACLCAFVYFALNTVLTILSLSLSPNYYGCSSIVAGILASFGSSWLLKNRVDDLLFRTFTKAPVTTLPHQPKHLQGIGEFHFQKEIVS